MKKLFVFFAVLLSLTLSVGSVAAQADQADVAEAADNALAADPDALLEGLAEAPDDDLLPETFLNPIDGTPAADPEILESFDFGLADATDAEGEVQLIFDADTSVITSLVAVGSLNFVVFEDEDTAVAEFEKLVEESETGSSSDGVEVSLEETEFAGGDAAIVTATVEDGGVFATVKLIVVPVGNVLVVSTVVLADQSEIDADEVQGYAEDLLNTGVLHLNAVAEDAQ